MPQRISYAQNGEDVRLWHAFGPREGRECGFVYVDVGANEPWHFSVTAALGELGWRGLLIEADPELADRLRAERIRDVVVNAAAADREGELTFFRVPGTGLGTMDAAEAAVARDRGFAVQEVTAPARRLDDILDEHASSLGPDIHAMTIDVEGAESIVLDGLTRYRPWVICVEAVEPGTSTPSHTAWEHTLTNNGYVDVAFDGINRWYVATEHADQPVPAGAGAPEGTTIAEAIATPFHAIDIGEHGWQAADTFQLRDRDNRAYKRISWQRELLRNDHGRRVPRQEYERQITELRDALVSVEGSRTFRLSRKMARVAKAVVGPLRRLEASLKSTPWVTQQRHLRHVNINMGHLTNPDFLTQTANSDVDAEPFERVPPGLDLLSFTPEDAEQVRIWLQEDPFDHDERLFARLDNRNDVVGRVRTALRSRIRISELTKGEIPQRGGRVAFDARSLQSPAFGNRGIGRFAAAALAATRQAVGDQRLSLIVDRGLLPLPAELAGECEQITRINTERTSDFGALICPSPMTQSPDPLLPLLGSDVYSLAIVFDFIPLDFPDVYLRGVAERAEYAACLDALVHFMDFACISHTVRSQLESFLRARGTTNPSAVVAWPRDISVGIRSDRAGKSGSGTIVIASGDDPRKNTFGGLAGVAAATVRHTHRDVIVLGMAGHNDRVHHWSIAAAMRPGEARTLARISDDELADQLASADVVVVPSFAEGLSLPVIEALGQGTVVVASDIPAHRELIGSGAFLADPKSPRSIARAVKRTIGKTSVARTQSARLARHQHDVLEDAVIDRLKRHVRQDHDPQRNRELLTSARSGGRLRIALATPWAPQKSGVADYSVATGRALAELCELTVFTTSDAELDLSGKDRAIHAHRPIEELLADPQDLDFDAVIAVVGNSHFHLPFIELTKHVDCIVIAHDTRMIEYYLALRGIGGVQELMQRTLDPNAPKGIVPVLDDQISDMRLLQNAGLWEIARRAPTLITHSPTTAHRIELQTGVAPVVLPFVNYRPAASDGAQDGGVGQAERESARQRLGLPTDSFHLATFGFVDIRTKQVDTVLEAAGWLSFWGHSVDLTVVGSAPEQVERELAARAQTLGLAGFLVTGFQSEERYRDWLLAVDLGVQLRVSPFLGVSGPLADMAAVGTPAVASAGLCRDVDTPPFIEPLPDVVSPVTLAEAIERHIAQPIGWSERDAARREYLRSHSPVVYAAALLEVVRKVAR